MKPTVNSLRRLAATWGTVDHAMFMFTLLAFAVGGGILVALGAVGGDAVATPTVPAPVQALYYFPAQFPVPSGAVEPVATRVLSCACAPACGVQGVRARRTAPGECGSLSAPAPRHRWSQLMSTNATANQATPELLQLEATLLAADRYLRELGGSLADWLEKRRASAATLSALEAMSERELRDIGVSRADLQNVASGGSPRAVDGFLS